MNNEQYNILRKYSAHLYRFVIRLGIELNIKYGTQLDYIERIEQSAKQGMDLLDICKLAHDNNKYAMRSIGVHTLKGLCDFMKDEYNITISQYTAEELNKLIKQYITSRNHDIKEIEISRSYHISFDVKITMRTKGTDDISKTFKERIQNSIDRFCGVQSNIEIKEISE